MPWLAKEKRRLSSDTGSAALRADAAQSALCAYLSLIAMVGLGVNAIWHVAWADPVAALVVTPLIVWEAQAQAPASLRRNCGDSRIRSARPEFTLSGDGAGSAVVRIAPDIAEHRGRQSGLTSESHIKRERPRLIESWDARAVLPRKLLTFTLRSELHCGNGPSVPCCGTAVLAWAHFG
jgi:hypothetical protein